MSGWERFGGDEWINKSKKVKQKKLTKRIENLGEKQDRNRLISKHGGEKGI